MKKISLLFLLFSLISNFSMAATQLKSATVKWKVGGVWNTPQIYSPGATAIIRPDAGSPVNVTIERTSDASLPVDFYVIDMGNNSNKTITTNLSTYSFTDCAGALDTDLRILVNTNEGSVIITVLWTKPPTPDLSVSNLTVEGAAYPAGLNFLVGQTVNINCNVWNISKAAAGSSQLGLYIKTSSANTTGTPVQSQQVAPIGAGYGSPQTFSYTFTSSDVGSRYFVFKADYTNLINEAVETNNVSSFGPFTVSAPVNMSLAPTTAAFGSVNINECSAEQGITLNNNSAVSVSGTASLNNSTHYGLVSGGGSFTLSAGSSKTIKVKFCPVSAGSLSTILKVVVAGTSAPAAQATLTGTGVTPPEIITSYSPSFLFDTQNKKSGGIYLKIIETNKTNIVTKVGYKYSWGPINAPSVFFNFKYFDVKDGHVFLTPPEFPNEANFPLFKKSDFDNSILLFDKDENQVGHIRFDYSFEWECETQARQAIILLHNDGFIFGGGGNPNRYFPYQINSPNNPTLLGTKIKYNYYKFGEYPVSMLIPPATFTDKISRGFVIPEEFNEKPVLFVHGLTGSFYYEKAAQPKNTDKLGDQVSYWYDTPQILDSKMANDNARKFHAWQFYYPNEDDLTQCALMLKTSVDSLYALYKKPINFVAHSMGTLVTMEYLTSPDNYNPQKIGKVMLTTPPIHGSLGGNRNYMTPLGFVVGGPLIGQDPKAPCYRDLSIGSDFIYKLQHRVWDKNLIDNTFVLLGLTAKEYYANLDHALELLHTESENSSDFLVNFSSGSLLEKGIGFLGVYGNHDDGKFSKTLKDKYFIPNLLDAYFDETTNFTEYCTSKSQETVEIFVDGTGNILKPSDFDLKNIKSNRSDVEYQKGMVTIVDTEGKWNNLYLYLREKIDETHKVDYLLTSNFNQTTNADFKYTSLGKYQKNPNTSIFGSGSSYYYTKTYNKNIFPLDPILSTIPPWWDNTGFEFQKGAIEVVKVKGSPFPEKYTNIEPLVLRHQFVGDYEDKKSLTIPTEETPTKEIHFSNEANKSLANIFIDDQTTLVDFYLYNEDLEGESLKYTINLISPTGAQIDSTSTNISYSSDPYTSVKKLTVQNPVPGKWKVIPSINSSRTIITNFLTRGKLASGITSKSLTEQKNPVNITGMLTVPDPGKLNNDSTSAYAIIVGVSGQQDTLKLKNVQFSGSDIKLSNSYQASTAGSYNYTMIITGFYHGYRFERALYGDFVVENQQSTFSIPDLELNDTKTIVSLSLPDYLNCIKCDPASVTYEVSYTSSTFMEGNFSVEYDSGSKTLAFAVVQNSPNGDANFLVEAYSAGTLIASSPLHVKYTASGIPTQLSASSITRNSAELSWIPKGMEAKWEILFGYSGFNPATGGTLVKDIVNPSIKLDTLQQGNSYDFYVRAVLDATTKSSWSWPLSFVTNHLVTISSGPNGHSDPTGVVEVLHEGNLAVNFIPNEGYHVQSLVIDGKSVGIVSTYQFERVADNHSVEVSFATNTYTISTTIDPPEAGTVGGAGTFMHGESVNLMATPKLGFAFADWSESWIELGTGGNLSFPALKSRSIQANFKKLATPLELKADSITLNTARLSWLPSGQEGKWEILYGLSGFDPLTGGTLLKDVSKTSIKVDALQQGKSYDFYVRAAIDLNTMSLWSASFSFTTNQLITISSGAHGHADPTGASPISNNSNLIVNFVPDDGYHVKDVVVDTKSVGAVSNYTIDKVTENHSIAVSFEINTYTINITINPPLAGTVSGTGTYSHGDAVNLNATPLQGFVFNNWTENQTILGTSGSLSFNSLTNRTLQANFNTVTGVNSYTEDGVLIYPNPTNNGVYIKLRNGELLYQIRMINMGGIELMNQKFNKENSIYFSVLGLSQGVYIMHLITSKGLVTAKIQVVE